MNRHERRATRAKEHRKAVDHVVAVHEAGHVVAYILVAESLGRAPDEMLCHIDINPTPIGTGATSFDGTHALKTQAVTYGRTFSRAMADFIEERMADKLAAAADGRAALRAEDFIPIIAEMRTAGIDVDWWYRATNIIAMFGPMAEAKLLGKAFDEIWKAYSSENDRSDVVRNGRMCGMTPQQIAVASVESVDIAEQVMESPSVWAAILALADKLKHGRMPGTIAAKIVLRELGPGLKFEPDV